MDHIDTHTLLSRGPWILVTALWFRTHESVIVSLEFKKFYLQLDTHPTVDELLSQQAAHDDGAEVDDVLDLPERLLCCLQNKHTGKDAGEHTGELQHTHTGCTTLL